MQISQLALHQQDLQKQWDHYVQASPHGTLCHLTAWMRVINKTFGHRPYYLYANNNGHICGVLPLVLVKSRLFGKMLVSTAFAAYGGALADDEEVEKALLQASIELGKRLGVDYVEFRYSENGAQFSHMQSSDLYVTFRQQLCKDPEENFKALPREARRLVRRAREAGLRAEFRRDCLDDFYRVYAESVRNLGTPVFSKKMFENFLLEFPDSSDILCISLGNKTIAAVLTFYYRDTVMPYYGGSLSEYKGNKIAANNFMYWTLIETACQRGYKWFDFGRSKVNTGSYHFKRHFGMKPQPLHYQFALLKLNELPNLNPLNPKFGPLINLWKSLPLSVTQMIGPRIVKNIP